MDPEPAGDIGKTGPNGWQWSLHGPRLALAVGLAPFAFDVAKTEDEMYHRRIDYPAASGGVTAEFAST